MSHPNTISNQPRFNQAHQGQPFGSWGRQGHAPRGSFSQNQDQRPRHNPGLSQSHRRSNFSPEEITNQSALLEALCFDVILNSEIERSEIAQNESFRQRIELICRNVIAQHEHQSSQNPQFPPLSAELKCFGSLSSGFATKASDMDLGLLSPLSAMQPDAPGSPIPRLIEKAFLDAGLGARLLSRTRVPIIKLCERPPQALHQELLKHRQKWESGQEHDHAESNDDEEDHTGAGEATKEDEELFEATTAPKTKKADGFTPIKEAPATSSHADDSPSRETTFEVPNAKGEMVQFHLKQICGQSLSAYCGLAKRVLRKAGGRDVTMSNFKSFTELDWAILNRLCQAQVQGLADVRLKDSLMRYPTLAFNPHSDVPQNRSLIGVSLQIEGEQILQSWEKWPAREHLHQASIAHSINSWDGLQWEPNFGYDPMAFTKELQMSLDKLKKIPAFQLLLLEQGPQETDGQYASRTKAILKNIHLAPNGDPDAVYQEAIAKYVAGISDEDMRKELVSWKQTTPGQYDLDAVVRRHKSLHLAEEMERALQQNMYEPAHTEAVKQYIDLLRSPLRQLYNSPSTEPIVAIPIPDGLSSLVATVKTLPDPHKMAPNRERTKDYDPLEFPKSGAGVQCDINFSAHLALQNTLLLRCYSHTDPRVRPMVLFIKHWAKVRGINSGYRGTLSSYGYVLMVLHYLVNIAQPFVCPNLQQVVPPVGQPGYAEGDFCKGYNVRFWRNEREILHLASNGQINQNRQPLGHLLRGFFEYFAQNGPLSTVPGKGFDWGRDVLSLRTIGGLLSKQDKGWTGAKTVYETQAPNEAAPAGHSKSQKEVRSETPADQAQGEETAQHTGPVKEVRLRYLFAVEDPFELDHNVARTVTHKGIVSIRDEFRRAWRIIQAAGHGLTHDNLLEDVNETDESSNFFVDMIDDIHGLTVAALPH
jgi:terminal uridylyltransferase